MFDFLLTSEPKQALRIVRHFAAASFLLVFTVVSIFFFNTGLFSIDNTTFISILVIFWAGFLIFTVLLRSGLNKRFQDPSLTIPQMLWGTIFLLTNVYLLDEWRGLMLMAYFGMFSFGFFKFNFREFLAVGLFVILGYTLIILYMFLYEPYRIEVELELTQLLVFSCAVSIMIFTGTTIHRLRERTKQQYVHLQEALEVNKKLATTDELTGLYNRRYFMEQLKKQKALSEREGSDFVIVYCDLDHFKQINDRFGHHTGDMVLIKFSEILKLSIREIDYAGRFGGEEFVCLLVNTEIDNAIKVTERIRESLSSYNFSDIAPSLHATVSIGISNFKQFNTIQETLMSADNRMYHAKQLGRNKVVFSDEEEVV